MKVVRLSEWLRNDSHAVEDGVPMPKAMRFKYNLDSWKVGQSQLFTNYNRADAVYKLAWQTGKRTGHKYSCRTMDGGGIRIWRIA